VARTSATACRASRLHHPTADRVLASRAP
jgi:hypothetical protein